MATKTARKGFTTPGANLREAQDQATKLFRNARKQVEGYLPDLPRKQLTQLQARLERASKDFEKIRVRAVKQARARVETFFGDVEKTAFGAVKPFVSRLDIASKSDVDRLRKRVSDLEKHLTKHSKASGDSAAA